MSNFHRNQHWNSGPFNFNSLHFNVALLDLDWDVNPLLGPAVENTDHEIQTCGFQISAVYVHSEILFLFSPTS